MGDWNDLDASLETAAHKCEMALESTDRTSTQVVYHLRTHTDEPATLTATRRDTASTACTASQPIHLEVHAGRHGNKQCESDLLYEVSHRLTSLRGVDTAPID